ncbi:DUF3617 domain-containing protein [Ottowia thiooxydans]|uniref:DUF3617 domain-containing protein n=1 Tax=Ottowia thiooxydans TaxID=219182 RepID=UPI000685DD28|nr:DUF3617 family protein [Ottowia thiooxydans]
MTMPQLCAMVRDSPPCRVPSFDNAFMPIRATLLSLLAVLAFSANSANTPAGSKPAPRPGLWEQVITGNRTPSPITLKVCVGLADDSANSFGAPNAEDDAECQTNEVKRVGNDLSYLSVCRMNKGTMTSKGTVTGDLNSRYRTTGTIEVSGLALAPGEPKISRVEIIARYLGPCPAGLEPGDVAP